MVELGLKINIQTVVNGHPQKLTHDYIHSLLNPHNKCMHITCLKKDIDRSGYTFPSFSVVNSWNLGTILPPAVSSQMLCAAIKYNLESHEER